MTETRTTSTTGGQKGTKPQAYNLVSSLGTFELAKLYGNGAKKYAVRNFLRGYEWSKSYASLHRHLALFNSGENIDQEMNLPHLSSVAWHAITLYTFSLTHPQFDDRPYSYPEARDNQSVDVSDAAEGVHQDFYEELRRGDRLEPRFDLIPAAPIAALAELYGSGNVKPISKEGYRWSNAYNRLYEHTLGFWSGDNTIWTDQEHMIYVLHYAFELLELQQRFTEFDDRFTEKHGATPIGFDSAPKS